VRDAGARDARLQGATAAQRQSANAIANRESQTHRWSSADLRLAGNKIRHDYDNSNAFDQEWYNSWGGVWMANQMGLYSWAQASWPAVNSWFGTSWQPLSYDYGDEITYENGNVMLYGQPIATASQYQQSAANLANQGQQAPPKDAQWLPLGVFAALRGDEKSSDMLFQLAVDKEGTVRGNYFNPPAKNAQQLAGAVDKKTQRITWIVEDRKNIVFDTGLFNLTKNETPILVHFGKDKTEQWIFVRLRRSSAAMSQQ
jgi:hypothetical protein